MKTFQKVSAMHLKLHGWPIEKIVKIVRAPQEEIENLEQDTEFMALFDSKYRKKHYEQNHT